MRRLAQRHADLLDKLVLFNPPYPGIGGMNFEGPAPRPLERFWIGLADDGQILVDFGKLYAFEKGDWEKPDSFLKYAG